MKKVRLKRHFGNEYRRWMQCTELSLHYVVYFLTRASFAAISMFVFSKIKYVRSLNLLNEHSEDELTLQNNIDISLFLSYGNAEDLVSK